VVGGLLLWGWLTTESTTRRRAFAAGLVLLVISDLWFFGLKMVQVSATAPEPFWLQAREIIGETDQRILPWGVSLFWQNGPGQVGLNSVFGYNSLETSVFEDFTGSVPDPRATTYDILGVEYVVSPVALDDKTEGERPLTLIEQREGTWVYRRGRVVPIARLVYQYEIIADEAAAISRIHAPDFSPATAILAQEPDCVVGTRAEAAEAVIAAKADGHWRIETNSETPALLVLSESAYPGWRVTVDGQTAEPLTAYTIIRAVCVPAGQHVVEWDFRPAVYAWGGGINLLALALVGVALWQVRKGRGAGRAGTAPSTSPD
jgi:hypothetical protein